MANNNLFLNTLKKSYNFADLDFFEKSFRLERKILYSKQNSKNSSTST